MVEIYVVGAVVALIKVAGIAAVSLGPAFWAFSALVVVLTFKDNLMCYWTVWRLIDPQAPRSNA
jgi:paraquat-inducible protein A